MNAYFGKQNRPQKTSVPEFKGGNLQQYMQILYTHQKQCQKSGKYMQAQLAKKKLAKMRVELQKNKRQQMLIKHQQQKKQVQMAHVQQISQFNSYWDQKMTQYQQQAEKIQQEIMRRHQSQAMQFQQEIQKSLGFKQKDSSEIMNLRKIQQNLAKQENYIEAHKVQKQIQSLQRSQYEKWNFNRINKVRNLLQQLRNKQDTELSAMRQKIEQGFEQQKKIRSQQYDKLIQKYQNFMKQLQNHHNQELIKYDKTSKLQSTMNFSRVSNASSMSRVLQVRN